MSFENAVNYIPGTAKHFQQNPFLIGSNAFVPLNRQLSYNKNLSGVWADSDTYKQKVNATNAINNFKALESNINANKLLGLDEAMAAQFGHAMNQDGTFRPIEESSAMAYETVNNPYAKAALFDAAQKGALNTASREAWLNPENSINAQQGYGLLPRGVSITPTGDGRFQVSDGNQVFGTYTQPEMSMILSGVGNTNKVGAAQTLFGDFQNRAEVKYDYDTKLAQLKHAWNIDIANANAQGKAASAIAANNVKAIEGFQKFVTDNGLLSAAVSGDQQALNQLQNYAAYTEQAYGLEPGSITKVFLGQDNGPLIDVDVSKVGANFNKQRQPAQIPQAQYYNPLVGGL